MKKSLWGTGLVLSLLCSFAPASARSIKEELQRSLFGGRGSTQFFTDTDGRPLLSADPTRFGKPIQIRPLGSLIANAMSSDILSESAVVPVPSGSAGFAYEFNPNLNVFERKSIGLGAIFNERVDTLGKSAFAFGVAYIRQDSDEYNGEDISNLRIRRGLFAKRPFLGEFIDNGDVAATLDLNITTNTAAIWASYGLTDWLDVSFLLPVTEINLRARSTVRQVNFDEKGRPIIKNDLPAFLSDSKCDPVKAGQNPCRISDFTIIRRGTPFTLRDPRTGEPLSEKNGFAFSDVVDETRSGVGDLILRGKARFPVFKSTWGAFGGLSEFTFPTGDKDNFLGDDAFKARFLLLYSLSFFENRLNFHLNGGGRVTSQTSHKNTLEYGSAVDVRVTERLSLVAEMIGSWRVDPRLKSGGLLPDNFIDGAFGFKANPFRGLIVTASFRIPATDDGLRSDLVYLAGLEYDF